MPHVGLSSLQNPASRCCLHQVPGLAATLQIEAVLDVEPPGVHEIDPGRAIQLEHVEGTGPLILIQSLRRPMSERHLSILRDRRANHHAHETESTRLPAERLETGDDAGLTEMSQGQSQTKPWCPHASRNPDRPTRDDDTRTT